MESYSILLIPTVLNTPFLLKDINYNCLICDFEIEINIIINNNSSIVCENCMERIKLELKKFNKIF